MDFDRWLLSFRLFLLALTKNSRFLNWRLILFVLNLVVQLSHVLLVLIVLFLRPSNCFVVDSSTHSLNSRIIGLLAADFELFIFKHFRGFAELPVFVYLVSLVLLFEAAFCAIKFGIRPSRLLV